MAKVKAMSKPVNIQKVVQFLVAEDRRRPSGAAGAQGLGSKNTIGNYVVTAAAWAAASSCDTVATVSHTVASCAARFPKLVPLCIQQNWETMPLLHPKQPPAAAPAGA